MRFQRTNRARIATRSRFSSIAELRLPIEYGIQSRSPIRQCSMDASEEIKSILPKLDDEKLDLLLQMARALGINVEQQINPDSDILASEFVEDFSNRLIIHHATHEENFKKKAFEYAFCVASESAGRTAEIVSNQTNPGADVIVDGVRFSLKTEAAKSIRSDKITISKLMEARWIRDCQNQDDFARNATSRVVSHLGDYERILTLRAAKSGTTAVRYDLVEIPLSLLLRIGDLNPSDFGPPTNSGGSSATVLVDGTAAFRVVLDGSVEKITVSGLLTSLCTLHGSWTVPIKVRDDD